MTDRKIRIVAGTALQIVGIVCAAVIISVAGGEPSAAALGIAAGSLFAGFVGGWFTIAML